MPIMIRATVKEQTPNDGVVLQVEVTEDQELVCFEEWPATYGWSAKSITEKQEHVLSDGYMMLKNTLGERVTMQYAEDDCNILIDGEIPLVEVVE